MEILFLLLPVSFILVAIIIGGVVWAAMNNQFDNLDDAANRVLQDEEPGDAGNERK